MNYDNCIINKEQADSIALYIINDISSYIKEHESKYQEWLSQQKAVQ